MIATTTVWVILVTFAYGGMSGDVLFPHGRRDAYNTKAACDPAAAQVALALKQVQLPVQPIRVGCAQLTVK